MPGILLKLNGIPKIGFAHHFRRENYSAWYARDDNSFELAYIKNGKLRANLYGKNYEIPAGSVLILPRSLPVTLTGEENCVHTHCTIQLIADAEYTFLDAQTPPPRLENGQILLPFISLPCPENEAIRNELYTIISSVSIFCEEGDCSAVFSVLGILSSLSRRYCRKLYVGQSKSSLLAYKIKDYVSANIHKSFSLGELAKQLDKTPNYLNSVFKASTGISIRRYINQEKVRTICDLLENKLVSFKAACESVSIFDISYGYRLFKKHTGVTPSEFTKGNIHN